MLMCGYLCKKGGEACVCENGLSVVRRVLRGQGPYKVKELVLRGL